MINTEKYYFDTFQVTLDMLESLIAVAMKDGGDYSDLYFENSQMGTMILRDGEVNSAGLHTLYGVGIRVLKGDKTGYAYSESTAWPAMVQAARSAAGIAMAVKRDSIQSASSEAKYHGRPNPAADRYPEKLSWQQCGMADYVTFLKKIDTAVRAKDTRVIKVMASLSYQISDILMFNSLGELKYETRPLGSLSISAIFKQGDRVENNTCGKSLRSGREMLSDNLIEELACEIVKGLDQRFEARRPKGGEMCVVMGAGASGILLHEAMGHAFEADCNRKGQSIFSDKMGKRVCKKGINIIDDATIHGLRGSTNFDDEGVPGQRTCMVEDGVLCSYLHDRISARYYGVPPTGNGRRESFQCMPIPRMRSTYMENGEASAQDIIASVKKGIFVDNFSNGQVDIGVGDFTFYVKSGYLIENGKLTMPIKDTNIIGNGPQALADIEMVANDLIIDEGTWICGKEQQNVPVSCGIPTVLIKKLTIGGE